jgi:hypothetical protein
MALRVIHLHPAAPPKPPVGAACNGCGLCCAAEPCPLGMLLSRRRRGACVALAWSEVEATSNDPSDATAGGNYRCGVLVAPGRWLPWLPAPLARALARRWIAAGRGCDAELEPQPAAPPSPGQP